MEEAAKTTEENAAKQGESDIRLYPVSVKAQNGEARVTTLFPLHVILLSNIDTLHMAALYDDRSIRAHIHHARDLFSLSVVHSSLSTSLALQLYDTSRNTTADSGFTWLFHCVFVMVFDRLEWKVVVGVGSIKVRELGRMKKGRCACGDLLKVYIF
ncbi:hypothetical protein IFM89_011658 [Coptis chinensis]|uniref:Uncharacterized protein n=1 Tax=Coptis chinensis TaxID=261450 RepID=A0A835HSB3_9MAGN|nr:hypothetical protein IFM89_011658 [Coptis chinensis]